MGRHLVAGTASPRRTPAAVASVGRDLFADGGVTPPYEPPPFEQAIREHQAGGALPAWTDRRLEVSPPRPNPFTSSAASDAVARPTTAADEREWASEHSDDPIAEHSDDGSESPRGHLLDELADQPSGRAVARFSRDPEFELSDAPLDAPLPAELQWITPWIERGQVIKEVEELCGAGSVAVQLEELANQDAPVLREGLSNLRTQILNLQNPSRWPGNPDNQTEKQIAQREADKAALDFFAEFTVEVLRRVEERSRKTERDRRQRELDGGGSGAGNAWGESVGSGDRYQPHSDSSGSPERLSDVGWAHKEPRTAGHALARAGMERHEHGDTGYGGGASSVQDEVHGGYGAVGDVGRTGIFVIHEGYLMKKTASKPHRYQRKWFSIVTKEHNGLVDSRTMQYYDKRPPEGRETEVEAAHGIILPFERSIEPYHKRKFRLRIKPTDPTERVYCFQTDTEEECTEWMNKLNDESNPSVARRGGVGLHHQNFLDEARSWILEVYKKYKPGKLKDVDVLLAEWVGEEEELLQKIVEKYHPKWPPPEAPAVSGRTGLHGAALSRLLK